MPFLTKSDLSSDTLSFSPMSFFVVPGSHLEYSIISCHAPFRLWQFLRFSLFLITLIVVRSSGWIFCRMFLSWDLSDGFLRIRLGLWILERKTVEMMHHAYHIISRLSTWLITSDIDLGLLAKVYLTGFCIVKLRHPLFPANTHCDLWKEVTIDSPYLRPGELCSPSLKAEYLHKIIWSLSAWAIYLFSSIYLFIQLFTHIDMDSWIFIVYFWL